MLIAIVTFPGVIVHEIAHRLFCDLAEVPVYEVSYFRFGNPSGYVVHGPVKGIKAAFLIAMGPFFVNSLLCVAFTLPVSLPYYILTSGVSVVQGILMWLGISIGMHAFPSNEDMTNLKQSLKDGSIQGVTGFLISLVAGIAVAFFVVANFLRRVWFDLIYAIAISIIVPAILLGIGTDSSDVKKAGANAQIPMPIPEDLSEVAGLEKGNDVIVIDPRLTPPRKRIQYAPRSLSSIKSDSALTESAKTNPVLLDSTEPESSGVDAQPLNANNAGVRALNGNDFKAAVDNFCLALEHDPSYDLAKTNLSIALNNYALETASRSPEKALAVFETCVYVDPTNDTAQKNLDGVIRMIGKDPAKFEDRLSLAKKALNEKAPYRAIAEYECAMHLKKDGKIKAEIDKLLATKPKVPYRQLVE